MRLIFVRHADAGSTGDWVGSDEQRPLTDRGLKDAEKVARWLAALGVHPAAVLASPYLRADQTARILADALNSADKVALDPLLEPGFGFYQLRALIGRYAQDDELVLVGHEPDFSEAISQVIGGGRVQMKRGGTAIVELAGAPELIGRLAALVGPELLP